MKLRKLILLCVATVMLSSIAWAQDNVSGLQPVDSPIQGDTIKVYSNAMKRAIKVVIVLPAQYFDQDLNDQAYPTIYMLHGASDRYTSWPRTKDLDAIASDMGVIIVCPDGQDSWYFDSPIDGTMQFETFIAKELVNFVTTNYRTLDTPKQRAITGLSMGGHGAMYLAMRHTDVFGLAGSMSGGLDICPFPNKWHIADRLGKYEENEQRWKDNSAISQISRIKNGDLKLTIDCGVKDFFIEVNRNFHKALLDAGIDHDYTERPGGHTWPYWNNSMDYHLMFFQKGFEANAAE